MYQGLLNILVMHRSLKSSFERITVPLVFFVLPPLLFVGVVSNPGNMALVYDFFKSFAEFSFSAATCFIEIMGRIVELSTN